MVIFPLTPTPPVTTSVPVDVEVLAVFAVNVTPLLAANVVNFPVLLVVPPIDVLSIEPASMFTVSATNESMFAVPSM